MSPRGRKPKPSRPGYLTVVDAQDAPLGAAGVASDAASGAHAATSGEQDAVPEFNAPLWFGEEEKAVYEFLQRLLKRSRLVQEIDQIELQMLASAYGAWMRVQDELKELREKNGGSLTYIVRGRNGVQHKTYPQVHQAMQYEKMIGALGSNFGLSPVDRERIKYLRDRPEDPEQGDLYD